MVRQSFPIVNHHHLKKGHFMVSVVPSTVSLIPPSPFFFPYIIFLLLRSKTEGLWRLNSIKAETQISWAAWVIMEIIFVETGPLLTACSALLFSLIPLFWPLITLEMTQLFPGSVHRSWAFQLLLGALCSFFNHASQPGRWQSPCDSQED